MCVMHPFETFVVKTARWEKAGKAWAYCQKHLTRDQLYNVASEIGFGVSVDWDTETGLMTLPQLSEIQLIALAYAALAVVENGGQTEPRITSEPTGL